MADGRHNGKLGSRLDDFCKILYDDAKWENDELTIACANLNLEIRDSGRPPS